MSRRKSEATIQRERERAIRREERTLYRAEREAKRQARLERRLFKPRIAAIQLAEIRVKPDDSCFGLREVITYSVLMDCDRCHRITRERDLLSGVCEFCQYADPVRVDEASGRPLDPTVQLAYSADALHPSSFI